LDISNKNGKIEKKAERNQSKPERSSFLRVVFSLRPSAKYLAPSGPTSFPARKNGEKE
jgi:hypothetical protein